MASQRAAGQTLIAFPLDEKFLAEVDSARGEKSRSAFVREALYNFLVAKGHRLPPGIKAAPDRTGKGGRPVKMPPAPDAVTLNDEPNPDHKPGRKQVTYPTAKKAAKKKTK